ncbi:McrB family protein [Brachyspira aalborgi]|uniref:McrB family protein n=1 Tax=Brachyspira aalborgi TaxID=29522 RepID=UPI00241140D8|nr:AAA family ATPase [Brachyspira aalborgi]
MRYYVFKHGKDDYDLIDRAIKNKFCLCRYEYGFQDKTTTNNWNVLKEVKVRDIIILSSGNLYAWGYAIKPRFLDKKLNKIKLNCSNTIKTRKNNRSGDYKGKWYEGYEGYIEFEDCECFYEKLESLEDEQKFGQRIDIDEWRDYNRGGIKLNYKSKSPPYNTIQEINKEDALNIVRKLKNDTNFEFEDKSMEKIINILKNKKQIILQGAPGTGKTYSSSEIAVKLIDENAPSDRAELMKRYKELVDKEQIFFTTFHQSMDYEEFVEGIKPNTLNDNIIYELEDGIFKKACYSTKTAGLNKTSIEKAWNEFKEDLISKEIRFDSNNNNIGKITLKTKTNIDFYLTTDKNDNVKYKPSTQNPNNEEWRHIRASLFGLYNKTYESALSYTEPLLQYLKVNYNLSDAIENNKSPVVLIIDEINRGNISKIFGELITLLEVDKRKGKENEIEVILPYSKEKFSVPDNLYIIGTMNTADRSIGYIDYALRRRFAFISIKADKLAIENYYDNKNSDCKDKAINLFDEIKNLIDKNINKEFEADDIMIGHSYFMAQNFEELQNKLEYEIKPLLLEYFKDGILKSKETINNLNYE